MIRYIMYKFAATTCAALLLAAAAAGAAFSAAGGTGKRAYAESPASLPDDPYLALEQTAEAYGVGNADENFFLEKTVDVAYGKVYRFAQMKNGSPVFGKGVNIATDGAGNVLSVTADVSSAKAEEETLSDPADFLPDGEIFSVQKTYYPKGELLVPAYEFVTDENGGTRSVLSATDGSVLLSAPVSSLATVMTEQKGVFDETVEIGVDLTDGVYTLADPLRNIYTYHAHNGTGQFPNDDMLYRNTTGVFDDPIAVTTFRNMVKIYDFYADGKTLGVPLRGVDNSHDDIEGNYKANKESRIFLFIHYGVQEQNAHGWFDKYYNASMVGVGDGRPNATLYQLGRSADVMAHEYQHTITHFTVDFVYQNASGAIDEALSDILGALAEGHPLDDNRFWDMGEDSMMKGDRGLRSMADVTGGYRTSFDDAFPFCNEKHVHNECDNGGVHYNSTILTHAQYRMWKAMPEYFTKERIGSLWFSVIPLLNANATFDDFKEAFMETAKNLGFEERALSLIETCLYESGDEELHRVEFRNEDGTLLHEKFVTHGKPATYLWEEPALPATEEYEFRFSGWSGNTDCVTEDTVLTAQYERELRHYTVTYTDGNGGVLKQDAVPYGGSSSPPPDPEKPSDERFDYQFERWSATADRVTGDMTVDPIFTQTPRRYTVTFTDENGGMLKQETVLYGGSATPPSDPEKPSDERFDYQFESWEGEYGNVTKDETVRATFRRIRCYFVEFRDGDRVLSTVRVREGGTASPPAAPVRENTAQYEYTFDGWSVPLTGVHEDLTAEARFTATLRSYYVTFYSGGSVYAKRSYVYGDTAEFPDIPAEGFGGWYLDEACTQRASPFSVTGNASLYALWEEAEPPADAEGCGSVTLCILPVLACGLLFLRKRRN